MGCLIRLYNVVYSCILSLSELWLEAKEEPCIFFWVPDVGTNAYQPLYKTWLTFYKPSFSLHQWNKSRSIRYYWPTKTPYPLVSAIETIFRRVSPTQKVRCSTGLQELAQRASRDLLIWSVIIPCVILRLLYMFAKPAKHSNTTNIHQYQKMIGMFDVPI